MQDKRTERKIGGCKVTLVFAEKEKEGALENVRAILSNAYDARVENELKILAQNGR